MSMFTPDKNANTIHRDPADEMGREDLMDTDEALTAEFRHRIGLLPEEEEGLTEAFKASIGLTGPEPVAEVTEVDLAVEKQYEATLKSFKFEKFAKKNFQGGQNAAFSKNHIKEPLLMKRHEVDKIVAPLLWTAIQRFMGDSPSPEITPVTKERSPVMTNIYRSLEAIAMRKKSAEASSGGDEIISIKGKSEKRKSWRKVFSKDSPSSKKSESAASPAASGSPDINSNDVNPCEIPTGELNLIHYVVGHGILRRDLRDEIFCALCKQLRQNPTKASSLQGWILIALCAGCFTPSDQVMHYIQSSLRECPKEYRDYSIYTRRIMKRTGMNGPRYHPPNWLEFQATKMRKYVLLPVALPDGNMKSIEGDSAMTAGEICAKIAADTDLKDSFGFSLFITIFDKVSSLGSGLDHVMDAVSECEQLVRSKGRREEDAPWRLYFRKESFLPWHNPEQCATATNLIYHQIARGLRTEEYKTRSEDELARFVARRWYVDHGSELVPGKLASTLHDYLPRSALTGARSRDGWVQAVMASFTEQGFDKKCVPQQQVKWHIVATASSKWPLQFAGLFEAFRISGPRLPRNDVVLAVSGRGLFILDEPYRVVSAYRFYEIVEIFSSRSGKVQGQTISLITIKGEEYSFLSPNAETVSKLVATFLEGLRQRSKYAVGLQEFLLEDARTQSAFHFRQGDVIELLDDTASRDDWVVGVVDRTGQKGELPIDCVYILPTMEKPPPDFLKLFAAMSAADASTLPRKRGAVRLDSVDGVDKDSVARAPAQPAKQDEESGC